MEIRASPPPFGVLGGEAGLSNTLERTHLEDKRLALVDGRVELGLGTCEPSCVVHRQLVTRLGKRLAVASLHQILRHAHDDEARSRDLRPVAQRALLAQVALQHQQKNCAGVGVKTTLRTGGSVRAFVLRLSELRALSWRQLTGTSRGSAPGMLPFFLFCIYLTTNLGSLLLASAAQKKKTKFLNSSAVALSEAIKCAMSLLMIWAARRGANAQSMSSTIYRALFADPRQMLKACTRPYARPMVRTMRFAETRS